LTFDAEVHDVVSTDGTVVNDDVPSPKSNGIPLLDLEALLSTAASFGGTRLCSLRERLCFAGVGGASIRHFDVSHGGAVGYVDRERKVEGGR